MEGRAEVWFDRGLLIREEGTIAMGCGKSVQAV
jgi:hypothetical protein